MSPYYEEMKETPKEQFKRKRIYCFNSSNYYWIPREPSSFKVYRFILRDVKRDRKGNLKVDKKGNLKLTMKYSVYKEGLFTDCLAKVLKQEKDAIVENVGYCSKYDYEWSIRHWLPVKWNFRYHVFF